MGASICDDHGIVLPGHSAGLYSRRALPYGMITWATRGRFLGERHLYFVPQPDDVFSYGTREIRWLMCTPKTHGIAWRPMISTI